MNSHMADIEHQLNPNKVCDHFSFLFTQTSPAPLSLS
jgi:hypothetical protein